MSSNGINSVLVIRSVGRADGLTYKCTGENEYGNDERLIKLMVVEVPSRPMNVRVKDTWSRSASLTWSAPFTGNSPITSYVIQYWRKNSNEAGQSAQNHRRQELTVSGTQTSALITNLLPALTYEASVIAENQVGRSEPSENVIITTGEDEPASAPADVSIEARGPSTIKVNWKVPPNDSWNGKLLGFYVGFRPRVTPNTIDVQSIQGSGLVTGFSYRKVDFVPGQQVFEAFLTNLARGQDYDVIVKAFNVIGSGPDSHVMSVRTFDGDLPASPNLFALQTTQTSITLRWTYPSRSQSSVASVKRYVLYYQRQGDESWLEVGIPVEDRVRSSNHQGQDVAQSTLSQSGLTVSESGTVNYQLTGLDPGSTYKVYVVPVNNFGMGDPSNFVTTKTEQLVGSSDSLRSLAHSGDFNVLDMSRQIQLFFIVPIVCTIIMVVVIILAVYYCTKRMPGTTAQLVATNQQPTLQSGSSWGPEGTIQVGQRYFEFDKGGILKNNASALLGGTQGSDKISAGHQQNNGQQYQLPYGTMPMNSVVISDQKSWDRQSGPLKPLMTHIYDSPI